MNSKFKSLETLDFWKGFLMAIGGAMVFALINFLKQSLHFNEINWQGVIIAGCSAGLYYLFQKFFTNSDGQPFKSEVTPEPPAK